MTQPLGGAGFEAPTPSAIVGYLDQYVVGQHEAKKVLAVAVYAHYRKLGRALGSGTDMVKSNVLLVGPTGTGKTLLCETLAQGLKLPFVTADATSLVQSQYVNQEVEAILHRLLDRAGGDMDKAQRGIVFIDEIDKLRAVPGQLRATSGESVQYALLKIMEGAHVRLTQGAVIDTSQILFICGGAFVGLENITARTHVYGFITTSGGDDQKIIDRLNSRIKPTDLFEYGLIPEFTGRLPIIACLDRLSREMLVRIMTEPRNALYRQYAEMLQADGVMLAMAPAVFEQIAEMALEYKVGARSLRGIFEETLAPVLYELPDRREVRRVEIESLFEPARLLTA